MLRHRSLDGTSWIQVATDYIVGTRGRLFGIEGAALRPTAVPGTSVDRIVVRSLLDLTEDHV